MRLLDETGKQVGVVALQDALKQAQDAELDLVEIAPEAKPPVAKIIDYKKFQYLEERKQKEARKHTKETELKEVRVSPFIGDHDLEVALKKVRKFLGDGDMVKISVVFKGRQMRHTEFGPQLQERILTLIAGIGERDRDSRWEGRRFVSIVKPTKEALQKAQQEKKDKEKLNKKSGTEDKKEEVQDKPKKTEKSEEVEEKETNDQTEN